MTVRAKFVVSEVTLTRWGMEKVALSAIEDDGIPENKRFHDATPSGELGMTITNTNLYGYFKPGQEFYVDLTPTKGDDA